MKGVAPVIAMVLIVLITIAMAGSFLVWTQRTTQGLSESGTEESQRLTGSFAKGVRIDALDCSKGAGSDTMAIRNSGDVTWTPHQLNYFINDTLNTSVITFSTNGNVVAGALVTATLGQDIKSRDVIRVAFQEASDFTICD